MMLAALLVAGLARPTDQPQRLLATLDGHANGVIALALSPDNRTAASGGYDRTIKLWDLGAKKARATLRGHTDEVTALAFTPDGRTLASGSSDGTVRLWDWARGEERCTLHGHRGSVLCLAFSPSGRVLASGGDYGALKLWDLIAETAAARPALQGHAGGVRAMVFTPDGGTLASAAEDGSVKLWDVEAGKERATLRGHASQVIALALAPGGRMLASGGIDRTVRLWEAATGQERATLRGHAAAVYAVAFSPRGVLASAGLDRSIKLWDVTAGQELAQLDGHRGSVYGLGFAPDGRSLTSASTDWTVKLWEVPGWERRPTPVALGVVSGLWADLAGEDAPRSFRSMGALLASPRQCVALLGERLQPAAPLPQSFTRWVADLGDEEFAVRQKATEDLIKVGSLAEPGLREALQGSPSLEVRRRLEGLLDRLAKEQLREVRALEVLEYLGTPEAQQLLTRLAEGAPEARLTREAKAALKRLQRR
jgi:predicted NACHT family NTPase